jgi:hypothetical protein
MIKTIQEWRAALASELEERFGLSVNDTPFCDDDEVAIYMEDGYSPSDACQELKRDMDLIEN